MSISHIGQSNLYSHHHSHTFSLNNLFLVPGLTKNLMSVSQFAKENRVFFEFHSDVCFVRSQDSKEILLRGINKDGLYAFPDLHARHSSPQKSQCISSPSHSTAFYSNKLGTAKDSTFLLWHSRLGHPSSPIVQKVLQFCHINSDINKISYVCGSCCLGKHHQLPFVSSKSVYHEPLDLIYTDIWGPSPIPSTSGARYYITFMDANTKHIWFYLINQKSQAFSTFLQFKTLVENQLGKKIKAVQTDNAKELLTFSKYLKDHGILHRLTCPHTHEQNGSIERKHRHITSMGLTLLAHASLPLSFWGEAFHTASHLINLLPTPVLQNMSPYQKLFHKPLDYTFLRPFGCACCAPIHPTNLT